MDNQLSKKLNYEVRSNKGNKVIIIKLINYTKFKNLVEPYIIPEMKYKLP